MIMLLRGVFVGGRVAKVHTGEQNRSHPRKGSLSHTHAHIEGVGWGQGV